jgi:hypothetical protein
MRDTLDCNLDRLPLTRSALNCCAESLAGYLSRCLCWAFNELQKQSIYQPQMEAIATYESGYS